MRLCWHSKRRNGALTVVFDYLSTRTDQDQQLDIIGRGVANLKNYSLSVKDESELHVRLLSEIDDDVSRAATGLESEGARAAKVRMRLASREAFGVIG